MTTVTGTSEMVSQKRVSGYVHFSVATPEVNYCFRNGFEAHYNLQNVLSMLMSCVLISVVQGTS